jgi:hypothetical protein
MPAAATLVTSALLALTGGALDAPSHLSALDPATLRPRGPSVRLPSWAFGLAWARSGSTVAIVAKPSAMGQPVRLVDARRMRVTAVIGVGERDVCGLTFRGLTLVALASDRPCYWKGGRFSIVSMDVRLHRIVRITTVGGLDVAAPTNLAFGDNFAFVARVGGRILAVDLTTGAVGSHSPRRSLAKGEGIVPTRWLGGHLLAVGPRVIDVRTWRARLLEAGARGVAPAGDDLVAYGPRGVAVYTRGGTLRFRALTDASIGNVHVQGRYLYAADDATADVLDLRTRREARAVADAAIVWGMLGA